MRKIDLTATLLKSGWEMSKIENMYIFLDSLLKLSVPLEIKYVESIKKIEGDKKMQYMTTIERHGFAKGRLEGIQLGREEGEQRGEQRGIQLGREAGEQSFLEKLLKIKFKKLPIQYIEKIQMAKLTDLDQWGSNLIFADTLEDVFKEK